MYLQLVSGSEEIELPLLHPEEDCRVELPVCGLDLTELLLLLLLLLSLGVMDAFGSKPLLCHPWTCLLPKIRKLRRSSGFIKASEFHVSPKFSFP